MKKNLFFKIVMLLTVVVLAVNCKDYDDDISNLQKQVNALKSDLTKDFEAKMDAKVAAMQTEINAAKEALSKAATKQELVAAKGELATKEELAAAKNEFAAAKEELMNKVVSLETYNAFKEDVMKKLEAAGSAEALNAVSTDVKSAEGRLAALEALLKIKEDGTFESIKELEVKIKANEDKIKALVEGGIDRDAFEKLLKEMGINISAFSGVLSSAVLYPETYIMGVEAVVLHPFILNANFDRYVAVPATDDSGEPEVWGPICPVGDTNTATTPDEPDCALKNGLLMKGNLKDKKVFAARLFTEPSYVTYNLSPSSVDVSMLDVDNLTATSHLAAFTRAGGVEDEGENPFIVKHVETKKGKMTVEVDLNPTAFAKYYIPKMTTTDLTRFFGYRGYNGYGYDDAEGTTFNTPVLALQIPHSKKAVAEMPEGADTYVTTDYVNVYLDPYVNLDIAKKDSKDNCLRYSNLIENNREENVPDGSYRDNMGVINAKDLPDGVNIGNVADIRVVKLVEGETIDLVDYVQAIANLYSNQNSCQKVNIEKYGLAWKFDLLDGAKDAKKIKFIDTRNKTNQQEFITLSNEDKGTVAARVVSQEPNGAAVDRTPVVRVRIVNPENDNCVLSQAFIKILIVKEKVAPIKPVLIGTFNADQPKGCDGLKKALNWVEVNEMIYNKLGLSKQDFVKIYGSYVGYTATGASVGYINWIIDSNNGRSTYVPQWNVSICEMVANCCSDCKTDAPTTLKSQFVFQPSSQYEGRYPKFIINFTGTYTRPSVDVTEKQLNVDYWNDAFTEIEHHSKSQSPAGSTDSSTCTYKNNLNAAFRNPHPNQSLNLPGVEVTDYRYVFVADAKKQYMEGGITTEIRAEGRELYAKKAEGAFELIATIIPHTATASSTTNTDTNFGQDYLEYNENSTLAKELLNKGWRHMWARLQILVKCGSCNDENMEIPVSLNGNDNFVVYFLRPINAIGKSPEQFEDGVRFGLKGSILDIEKVVALSDWHKETFKAVPSFYQYYGVESIKINSKADIEWDSNGEREKIPSTLKVHWIPKTGTDADNTFGTETGSGNNYQGTGNYFNVDEIKAALSTADQAALNKIGKFERGALTYYNVGTTVTEDFYLYVPVQIVYKWGTIVTTEVKIKVSKTVVQE